MWFMNYNRKQKVLSFKERVLDVVTNIPKGKTLTYKQVAEKSGSPYAFRAVGNILKNNYNKNIPCHRVILSNGTAGKFNRGASLKLDLLRKERVLGNNIRPVAI
ncbi:MAG: MGMT family protein [Patescibacteria group bacterium]|nr:MGMT family protein [Patescibacteria group bacterium]MDE1988711.1 MGMT family protein [Patescibacteria group bacterium]MDE2218696.1 MGMT family protein [Patescibacteria group bacterium]